MKGISQSPLSLLALPRREFLWTGARLLGSAALAGADKVRAACLGCHDVGIIARQQLDRRGWGAPVRAADHEAILHFLAKHFAPPANPDKKER